MNYENDLLRFYKYLSDSNIATILISAYKYKNMLNKKRTDILYLELRNEGLGFIRVDGFWSEKDEFENSLEEEKSYLVISQDEKRLMRLGIKLMDRFKQDSFLIKHRKSNRGEIIYSNGSSKKLGTLTIDKIEKIKIEIMNTQLKLEKDIVFKFTNDFVESTLMVKWGGNMPRMNKKGIEKYKFTKKLSLMLEGYDYIYYFKDEKEPAYIEITSGEISKEIIDLMNEKKYIIKVDKEIILTTTYLIFAESDENFVIKEPNCLWNLFD